MSQQLKLASEFESDLYKTLGWGRKWLIDFNAENMNGSVFEEKLSFKILGVTFSSKLDWGTYIISIAKTASKKIGAFSINFNKVSFWCPYLLLGIFRQATKTNIQNYCSFTCCLS